MSQTGEKIPPVIDPSPKAAQDVSLTPVAPPAVVENLGSPPVGEGEGGVVVELPPSPAAGEGEEKKVAPPPAPDRAPQWKAEKYDKVLAQKRELEEEIGRLRAAQDPNAPKLTEADINARASQQVAEMDFNRRANAAAEAGKAAFPDFLDKMEKIREQVDANDPAEQQRFIAMVAATLEVGEAAPRILYELGSNPDLATEMMRLSPVQQGMRIARMAEKKPDPEPSSAPKPMSVQVGGRGVSGEEIDPSDPSRGDKLSTRTWMERRQADIEKKKKEGVRIW